MLTQTRDLFALHVADEDASDYGVRDGGWYAADECDHVVLGPFASLAECEREIHDRANLPG